MSVVLVSMRDAAPGPVGRKRCDDRFLPRSRCRSFASGRGGQRGARLRPTKAVRVEARQSPSLASPAARPAAWRRDVRRLQWLAAPAPGPARRCARRPGRARTRLDGQGDTPSWNRTRHAPPPGRCRAPGARRRPRRCRAARTAALPTRATSSATSNSDAWPERRQGAAVEQRRARSTMRPTPRRWGLRVGASSRQTVRSHWPRPVRLFSGTALRPSRNR